MHFQQHWQLCAGSAILSEQAFYENMSHILCAVTSSSARLLYTICNIHGHEMGIDSALLQALPHSGWCDPPYSSVSLSDSPVGLKFLPLPSPVILFPTTTPFPSYPFLGHSLVAGWDRQDKDRTDISNMWQQNVLQDIWHRDDLPARCLCQNLHFLHGFDIPALTTFPHDMACLLSLYMYPCSYYSPLAGGMAARREALCGHTSLLLHLSLNFSIL